MTQSSSSPVRASRLLNSAMMLAEIWIEEKFFRGPLHMQIYQALDYLNAFSASMVRKAATGQAQAQHSCFPLRGHGGGFGECCVPSQL